jgi:hypothetical protein
MHKLTLRLGGLSSDGQSTTLQRVPWTEYLLLSRLGRLEVIGIIYHSHFALPTFSNLTVHLALNNVSDTGIDPILSRAVGAFDISQLEMFNTSWRNISSIPFVARL